MVAVSECGSWCFASFDVSASWQQFKQMVARVGEVFGDTLDLLR